MNYNYQSNISAPRIERPGDIAPVNPYGGDLNNQDVYGQMYASNIADMSAYEELANSQIENAELKANRDAALNALNQMQSQKQNQQQLENAFRNQLIGAVNPILSGILG